MRIVSREDIKVRRKDKEIKDVNLIQSILRKASVCRIALSVDNKPYVVPVNYGYKNNIYYYTQNAMLDTPDSTAFSILRIYLKEMTIEGFGRVPDRILPYNNFKKKILQIALSDTLLHYSHLKNDLTGYLSYVSPDTNMLANYVLDTTLYHNQYFRVSNDSLILNTDVDLSLITDLKIGVIAVDCDADTFSQTFNLFFDTI